MITLTSNLSSHFLALLRIIHGSFLRNANPMIINDCFIPPSCCPEIFKNPFSSTVTLHHNSKCFLLHLSIINTYSLCLLVHCIASSVAAQIFANQLFLLRSSTCSNNSFSQSLSYSKFSHSAKSLSPAYG